MICTARPLAKLTRKARFNIVIIVACGSRRQTSVTKGESERFVRSFDTIPNFQELPANDYTRA